MKNQLTVYKASAGSGKTFTLTVEYISLLLSNENPTSYRSILAVTFTNKATAEMKMRIMQQLYGIGFSLPESDTYLQQIQERTALAPNLLRERAQKVLLRMIHDYDHFRVETIDSFFQSILSSLSRELHLAANVKVDINDIEIIETAVDLLLAELTPNSPILVWILSYIRERIEENQRWDISKEVKNFAKNLVKEKYLINEEQLNGVLSDNEKLESFKKRLRERRDLAIDVIQSAADHFLEILESYQLTEKDFSNGKYLYTYLKCLSEGTFKEPNLTLQKYLDGYEKWLRKADLKNSELVQLINDVLCPMLNEVERLRSEQVVEYNSCLLTLQHLNPLRLLNVINSKVNQLNQDANRFLLAKTPILLHRLVGDDDASFVMEKSGTRFRHIMIDEFQDTSTLQWHNFRNLIFENLAAGSQSLLVGDVKQSIYRWRNGDWSILHHIQQEFPTQHICIKNLDTNFRSEANIIAFNNHFFRKAADVLDAQGELAVTQPIKQLYEDVQQNIPLSRDEQGGYIHVHLLPAKKEEKDDYDWKEEMLTEMADKIDSLHCEQHIPFSQMAILVRNNIHATAIVNWFSIHHPQLPIVSGEAFLFSSSSAVNLLIYSLRYIANPNDDVAAAYVALYHQQATEKNDVSPEEIFSSPQTFLPAMLYKDRELLYDTPLYELTEQLCQLFLLFHCENEVSYLHAFIDEVQLFLSDHASNIEQFITYWEDTLKKKAIPTSDEVNGIRILTIHKSKGLQFHTLFMPFTNWKIENDRPNDLLWCKPIPKPYNELPLAPISTNALTEQSVYAADYQEEHLQRRIENLNLLYVGFTRAEKNLLVWGTGMPSAIGKKTMTIGDLIAAVLEEECTADNELIYNHGIPATYVVKNYAINSLNKLSLPVTAITQIPFDTSTYTQFRQSNESRDFIRLEERDNNVTQQEYILQGNLLHRLFSTITTSNDIEDALTSFEQQGLLEPFFQKERLQKLINRCLQTPQIADWFSPRWTLYKECDILHTNSKGETIIKRPDRVMIDQDEVVVVDFKFGTPRPEYAQQVKEYTELLQRMGYSSPKGYLWYVYTNQVVPINSDKA